LEKIKYHTTLSNYFSAQPFFFDGDLQKKSHIRKCVEQPFQQTKAQLWDEVTETLCNLDFIQAKAVARLTYELVKDFNDVLEVIPDNAENIKQEKARQERMGKYTLDLIECAKGEISIDELEIPESITPWLQEKINAEIERIKTNPGRIDKLKDFLNFLGKEAGNLKNYAIEFPYFAAQQAWNYSESGSVGKKADLCHTDNLKKLLLRPHQTRPAWNSHPLVLKSFPGDASVISITPNGKKAIAGSGTGSCVIWDLDTGKPLETLIHSVPVRSVCITPDGKFALTGTDNRTCFLWDNQTAQLLKTINDQSDPFEAHGFGQSSDLIQAVDITPDAKMCITSSDNNCILWDLGLGQMIRKFKGHSLIVTSVKMTPHGRYALSGSGDATCILWDLKTGLGLKQLSGHTKSISSVSITPDGRFAVSGSYDNTCIFWDIIKGMALTTFTGHNNLVHSVDITPDGKLAVSGSSDNKCLIWETNTGQILKTLDWSSGDYRCVKIAPDGIRVFSTSELSFILWDSEKGCRQKENEEDTGSTVSPENISSDRKYAITPSSGNNCSVWDLRTGRITRIFKGHETTVLSVRVVPDSNRVITCSNDQNNILWDIENGTILKTLVSGSNHDINEIIATPDGNRAIITTYGGWYFWNLQTGNALKISSDINSVNVKLTPDGRNAVYDYLLLDLETGRDLGADYQFITWPVAISPDGKTFISGSAEGDFTLVNIRNGHELRSFNGHIRSLNAISYTPDGRYVFTGSYDSTCIMWDLKTGKLVRKLSGYAGFNKTISITPDGKMVVLIHGAYEGNGNNGLILWELETGEIVARFAGSFSVETSALFPKGIIVCQRLDISRHGGTAILHASQEMLLSGPAIVTTRYIWDFEKHLAIGPSADCPVCGNRFYVSNNIVDSIKSILQNSHIDACDSPCLCLPSEAWEDPGLLGNCPKCGAELKFNPFIAGGD